MQAHGVVCEFADPDFVVMMFTPEISSAQMAHLAELLLTLPARPAIQEHPPVLQRPVQRVKLREAVFSVQECIPVDQAEGRILAAPSVNCPPAVPIVVCGEEIDASAVKCFQYYGIEKVYVVKDR